MTYIPALLEIRTLDSQGNQVILVDLLNNGNGIILGNWRPKRAAMKSGGVYQDSPYADGRRLVHAVYDNVTESLILTMTNDAPDSTFYHDSLLTQALQDAIDYGRNTWGSQPVFLAMQPRGGTNEQYALIVNGRTEEFADPFGSLSYQFQAPRSIADEIPLVIEREHWLETPPTLGVALELSAVQAYPEAFALSFSNSADLVNCGSDASIDNLTAGANGCTFEAWVKLDKLPTVTSRVLIKGQWALQVNVDGKISAFILAGTTNATVTGASTTLSDLGWHHIAMTYLNSTGRVIALWLDGNQVSYDSQIAAVGSLTSDAASSLYIGNISTGSAVFPGKIGWVRLSSTRRYTSDFTPQARCVPPGLDADTEAQWNMQEGRGATVDNIEGTSGSDGAITGAIWSSVREDGDACGVRNYGNVNSSEEREPTTSNAVYISNKHTWAQITNIHIATGGANLINSSWPVAIHTVASLTSTYFGNNSGNYNSGPFDSLVFDIATAQVGATLAWEYWNGAAWSGLAVTDNTNSFQNTGVNSVHWIPPSDWTAASPGGSLPSGYYVRVRTTATGSVSATQQNRNPYTICWPYVEVQAAAVPGELEALARLRLHAQSGKDSTNQAPKTVFMGLRSVSRGGDFTPYINLSDTQVAPGMSVSALASAAFASNLYAPSGRGVAVNKTTSEDTPCIVEFYQTLAPQYRGKFRAYLRYIYDGTNTTHDIYLTFNADISLATSDLFHTTPTLTTSPVNTTLFYLDFGEVVIPDYVDEFEIGVTVQGDNTTNQLTLVDIILLPADEWIARFDDPFPPTLSVTYGATQHLSVNPRHYLDINHIDPKRSTSELIRFTSGVTKVLFEAQVSRIFFQRNEKQRIWFFQGGRPGFTAFWSPGFYALSVQAWRNAQYLGIRGNQ